MIICKDVFGDGWILGREMKKETWILNGKMSVWKRLGTERFWRVERKKDKVGEQRI